MRVIQYSRDASDETEGPRRTGYPAFAGYDDWEDGDIRALLRVFVLILAAGNDVGTGQPAVEVDIAAALGTERF